MDNYAQRQVKRIAGLVCARYGLKLNDLSCQSRERPLSQARQLTWKIAREIYGTKVSLHSLGTIFNRDHSTVVHGIKTINDLIYTDHSVAWDYQALKKQAKDGRRPKQGAEAISATLTQALKCTEMVHLKIQLRQMIYDLSR